ncbi:MAG: ABC transporter permease [Devosia sp.]|uniref:ABC transporter permease n=1 Tax=Devosia sp. TaxID=1871048 RepID=UPI00339A1E99
MDPASIAEFIAVALRVSTPLILAGLGVLISTRAGVLNIGIEGMMLAGAFAGVVASAFTGSAPIGLLAAILTGAALGCLLAIMVHVAKADLILSGIAINIAAAAGTTLLLFLITGSKGVSSSLQSQVLPSIDIPVVEAVPLLGTAISGHHVLTYVALLGAPLLAVFLTRTPLGIRLRAVGEKPEAAAAAGINVKRYQFWALAASGAFGGLAGAFLSMGYVSWFAQNMTAGRGFIALAAEVMGNGSALGTMASAILLGTAETISITMQGGGIPSELVQTIPYVVPILALLLHATRRRRLLKRSAA